MIAELELELILLLFILWLSTRYEVPSSDAIRQKIISEKLQYLRRIIEIMKAELNWDFAYELHVSDSRTFVKNKYAIYLVIWDGINNQPFDDNTLIDALIHELTHIWCPDTYHSQLFEYLEQRLFDTATELGFYDPEKPIAANYPCDDE